MSSRYTGAGGPRMLSELTANEEAAIEEKPCYDLMNSFLQHAVYDKMGWTNV
jgi:hypothetical protein